MTYDKMIRPRLEHKMLSIHFLFPCSWCTYWFSCNVL